VDNELVIAESSRLALHREMALALKTAPGACLNVTGLFKFDLELSSKKFSSHRILRIDQHTFDA